MHFSEWKYESETLLLRLMFNESTLFLRHQTPKFYELHGVERGENNKQKIKTYVFFN